MKKIISLFKRDYDGTHHVYDEIVPGAEWVQRGEGVATLKIDGTCCLVRDGKLFRRYDRKLTRSARKRKKSNADFVPLLEHFKPAPDAWEAAEPEPNKHTGHWPGWLPVGDGPEDKWHWEGFEFLCAAWDGADCFSEADGTYELIGPKVQGNPYKLDEHRLSRHGGVHIPSAPRGFAQLGMYFVINEIEGIVWHHPDGRMVKIKRKDFGYEWPVKQEAE